MEKMTIQHFLDREELVNALFSGVIELARIGHDGWNEVRYRLLLPNKLSRSSILSLEDCQEWKALITAIKSLTERSNSS